MTPMLSIIVPAYNCEAWIGECLSSVLCQLPENAELIVVDDGSEDTTPCLLAEYENTRENLHILYRPHRGVSGARNMGITMARGEYVAFLDCDDCLQDGFLTKNCPLPEQKADLMIFGIERTLLNGERALWTVRDGVYPTVHDFADEYIRKRNLLIYSNCNKFYRRSIIEKLSLRFEEDISFGEDRLFNYRFLTGCGMIVTSEQIMCRYLQRSMESMSAKSIPSYFDRVMELHRAKTDTFLSLSQNTDDAERQCFRSRDLGSEIIKTVDRFTMHPQEKAENLPAVNMLIFGRFPSLRKQLTEYGIQDPDEWYLSQTGRRIVVECLRTFYQQETSG